MLLSTVTVVAALGAACDALTTLAPPDGSVTSVTSNMDGQTFQALNINKDPFSLQLDVLMRLLQMEQIEIVNSIIHCSQDAAKITQGLSAAGVASSVFVSTTNGEKCDYAAEGQEAITWHEAVRRNTAMSLNYITETMNVVYGPLLFIEETIKQATELYYNGQLNIQRARWIFLATPTDASQSLYTTRDLSDQLLQHLFPASRGLLLNVVSRFTKKNEVVFDVTVGRIKWYPATGFALESSARLSATEPAAAHTWLETQDFWPQPERNFNKAVVTITTVQKPTVFLVPDDPKEKTLANAQGFGAELARIKEQYMNFTPIISPAVGFGSMKKNGSWNGMVGQMQRKEADFTPLDCTPSAARIHVVDISSVFNAEANIIISQATKILLKPFLLLQIFSLEVFLLLVAFVVFGDILLTILTWINGKFEHGSNKNNHLYLGSSTKFILRQAVVHLPSHGSERVLCSIILVGGLIITSLYSGYITSFLALPQRSIPIDTYEQLATSENKNLVLYTRTRVALYNWFMAQTKGPAFDIRHRLYGMPSTEINEEIYGRIANGTGALVGVFSSGVGKLTLYESRGTRCKFYVSKAVAISLDVFLYTRNSPTFYHSNKMLERLRSFGIIEYIRNQHYQINCEKELKITGPTTLKLDQCIGVVYIYCGFMLLSVITFCGELLTNVCENIVKKTTD